MSRVETEKIMNLYFIIGDIEKAKELHDNELNKVSIGFLHTLKLFLSFVKKINPVLAILLILDNNSNGIAFACVSDQEESTTNCLKNLFWCVVVGGLPIDCYYDLENFYWPFTDTNPPVKAILFYK